MDLKEKLKQFFPEYLRSLGLTVKGRAFQCPRYKEHAHNDRDLSGYMNADKTGGYCFRCGEYFDIFKLAHVVEGMPISGPEFINTTVKELAKRFLGIDISKYKRKESTIDYLFDKLVSVLRDLRFTDEARAILARRKWCELKYLTDLDVYAIPNEDKFLSYMQKTFTDKEQKSIRDAFGAQYNKFFKQGNILFVLRDTKSHIVGFAVRQPDGEKPKYLLTSKGEYFNPSSTLFNIHNVINRETKAVLYIVEGPADAITLEYAGLPAVALMGLHLNDTRISLLKQLDFERVVLMLDNDDAGRKATPSIVQRIYPLYGTLYIFDWSYGHAKNYKDPDEYLFNIAGKRGWKREIKEASINIPVYRYLFDQNKGKLDNILDFIAKIDQASERIKWIKFLSSEVDISIEELQEEIKKRRLQALIERDRRVERLLLNLANVIRYGDSNKVRIEALKDTAQQIEEIEKSYHAELKSLVQSVLKDFDDFKSSLLNPKKIEYFKIDWPKFAKLQFDGIGKEQSFTVIGGDPHVGKSSLIRNLMIQLLKNNPDATVIYHTTDDSRKRVYLNLLGILSSVPIYHIRHYAKLRRKRSAFALEAVEKIEEALAFFENNMASRIIITDVSDGNTVEFLSRLIEQVIAEGQYPIVFIDSINNLGGLGDNEYIRMSNIYKSVKTMSMFYNVPVFATAELRKEKHGDLSDFSDTRKAGFEPDINLHIDSRFAKQLDATPEEYIWEERDPFILASGTQLLINPIVEVYVRKNKISGFSEVIHYKLRRSTTEMFELSEPVV